MKYLKDSEWLFAAIVSGLLVMAIGGMLKMTARGIAAAIDRRLPGLALALAKRAEAMQPGAWNGIVSPIADTERALLDRHRFSALRVAGGPWIRHLVTWPRIRSTLSWIWPLALQLVGFVIAAAHWDSNRAGDAVMISMAVGIICGVGTTVPHFLRKRSTDSAKRGR